METRLSFRYDREADILHIDKCAPYAAQESEELGDEVIARINPDTEEVHLSRTTANATPSAPGQLGLAVFIDNLAQKAGNARRSLEERQVRLVRGIFRLQ